MTCSMVDPVLNWLIEYMMEGGLLRRLVYRAVESMVKFQLQQNSVIMMIFSPCIVGFSLYCVFTCGETNSTCFTAIGDQRHFSVS